MPCETVEHTQLVIKMVLLLCYGKLTILTKFRDKVGVVNGGTGGGYCFAFGLLSVFKCGEGSVEGVFQCRWDSSRLHLMTNLRLAFPIAHFDGLDKLLEVGEDGSLPTREISFLMQSGRPL